MKRAVTAKPSSANSNISKSSLSLAAAAADEARLAAMASKSCQVSLQQNSLGIWPKISEVCSWSSCISQLPCSQLVQIAEQGLVQPRQLAVAHVQQIRLAKIGKQTKRQLAQPVELHAELSQLVKSSKGAVIKASQSVAVDVDLAQADKGPKGRGFHPSDVLPVQNSLDGPLDVSDVKAAGENLSI